MQGGGVDHLDLGDGAQHAGVATGAVGHVRHAGDGEDDVVGGHGFAVMPGGAGPELELPECFAERLPAGGQAGGELGG